MKTFTRDYNISGPESEAFNRYFGALRPCVFDIETSGLSYETSKVILTAMLVPNASGVRVTQFLAEDPFEEDLVINATFDHIAEQQMGYVVTYNGASFDVPFINRRANAQRLDRELCMYDLDMFRFLKKYTILPDSLRSMSQKSVEGYFGFASSRKDTITGRESVELFREYAKTGSSVLEKVILTHNREDVVQLYRILIASAYRDFKYVLKEDFDFHCAISNYGFPGAGGKLTVRPALGRNKLKIRGRQIAAPVNAVTFPDGNSDLLIEFIKNSASYEAELPVSNRSGNIFVDLRSLDDNVLNSDLTSLDGYVNDYLILSDNGAHQYQEINTLSGLLVASSYAKLIQASSPDGAIL